MLDRALAALAARIEDRRWGGLVAFTESAREKSRLGAGSQPATPSTEPTPAESEPRANPSSEPEEPPGASAEEAQKPNWGKILTEVNLALETEEFHRRRTRNGTSNSGEGEG